jgi:hypothetical protein
MLEAGAPRWQRYSGRETVFAHPRILSPGKAVSVQLLPRRAMLARHPDPGFRPTSQHVQILGLARTKSG